MAAERARGFDSVVRGGTLATPEGAFAADVGVRDGLIAAVGRDLDASGADVIDASGLVVAPGAIDVHTHFANQVGEGVTADDYQSGSRAAAAGGITSFVNFAFQEPGRSLRDAAERELERAGGRSLLDFGVHLAITDVDVPGLLDDLPALAGDGFTSLKLFTAVHGLELGPRAVLQVLDAAARNGLMVNVHAEDGPLVDHLTSRLLEQGRRSVEHLAAARPPETEAIATATVAAYGRATGCAVYFVHLSCRAALDAVRDARRRGTEIYVETRPAYLYLDASRYTLPDGEGNKFVCWPPLRSLDDQEALWEGLRSGEIQTYATDHTTWMAAQKMDPSLSFDEIPGGVSNVQTSIGMLYSEGVAKGRISLAQFVEVTASNPARLFGLWPRKGTLLPGADADLV
ncbi:MAG: amidohydrolase family protein, partial [Candidatus Dormibacteraceae bacterium]